MGLIIIQQKEKFLILKLLENQPQKSYLLTSSNMYKEIEPTRYYSQMIEWELEAPWMQTVYDETRIISKFFLDQTDKYVLLHVRKKPQGMSQRLFDEMKNTVLKITMFQKY